jgi:deoxyadenosine/deoxycytidine kinase
MTSQLNRNFKIVSIEGNIGSGKSTLLEELKKHYEANTTVIFLREPVDEWEKIKDREQKTMLQKFYENQEKYSFPFQMMAYISRLSILRDTIKMTALHPEKQFIIITERCLYTDKHVFAKMLFDQQKIEDVCYQIYLNWFDEFTKDFTIDYIVYVNTDAKICYQRIHKRARDGEEVIPLSYLQLCNDYHNEYISTMYTNAIKQIALDGNIDIFSDKNNTLNKWIQHIDLLIYS